MILSTTKKPKKFGLNPKDILGRMKVSLSKLPAIAVAWGAAAMMDGARKYGPYNWRDNSVIASIYVDAAHRHLDLWFEGQRKAKDSKVHHLGHVIACAGILLDAEATGNLHDNRQKGFEALEAVFEEIKQNGLVQTKKNAKK